MAKVKAGNPKEPKKAPKSNITDELLDVMQQSVQDMCNAVGEAHTRPRSTIELLDELGRVMAETEANGTNILNFLQSEGRLAPQVDLLPKDPNARIAFIINRVCILNETLHSVAAILGAE